MKASDIMTRSVVTVTPETSIADAARSMVLRHLSGLPVVGRDGAVVGILTEGDLLRRAETGTASRHPRWVELLLGPGRLADEFTRTHARKVGEVMTTDVASVASETDLADLVQLMNKRGIKRLPIIDNGRLVGIVTRANLVRALVKALIREPGGGVGDDEIREAILRSLDAERWAPRFAIDVVVKNGIVDLSGEITDERLRTALQVLIESVPGVKVIRDHLVWVESVSQIVVPH
jgi:CBS domain-containing protein